MILKYFNSILFYPWMHFFILANMALILPCRTWSWLLQSLDFIFWYFNQQSAFLRPILWKQKPQKTSETENSVIIMYNTLQITQTSAGSTWGSRACFQWSSGVSVIFLIGNGIKEAHEDVQSCQEAANWGCNIC